MPEIIITEYGTEIYRESLKLRHEVLREPLGLVYTEKELDNDRHINYLIYIDNSEMLGVVGIQDKGNGVAQLKQMGISDKLKGQGIGRLMVKRLEEYAKEKGFVEVMLEARLYAKGFYDKLGYEAYGDVYVNIGIDHIKMKKIIA